MNEKMDRDRSVLYDDLVRMILALEHELEQFGPEAKGLGLPLPLESEWFSLLRRKLVPQLARRSHLVVSVTGGTNTGKSVIFNLLAGEKASATEAHAAGTKHPVAVLPEQTDPEEVLPYYFEEFHRHPWHSAKDPVGQTIEHNLFWKHGKNIPEKLILVDTPDIDSDVEVNWDRARQIRQVSDVLIGVMTSQKYNDASVKRFFREAVEADKPIILIWNMSYDDQYRQDWPQWISQLVEQTGMKPMAVFATPHAPESLDDLSLAVYDIGVDGTAEPQPISLQNYLAQVQFEKLKLQSLLGAVRRLTDEESGIAAYLHQIESYAKSFADAAKTLRDREQTVIQWPSIPKPLLAEEIGKWCNSKRPPVLQNISNAYDMVLMPVQKFWGSFRSRLGSSKQSAEHDAELAAVLGLVEKTIDQLKTIAADSGNPMLKTKIDTLLGEKRKEIREKSEKIHAALPPKTDDRIREEIFAILDQWTLDHPKQWERLHKIDVTSRGTHAVVTGGALLTCGVLGAGVALGAAALPTFLLAGAVTGGGEAIIKILGEEARLAVAELKVAIQAKYANWRKERFLEQFEKELWGEMLEQFDRNASIAGSETFLQIRRTLAEIRRILGAME